jgi:hypothetical protein
MDYADGELQRMSEPVAFTFADFAASDPRHIRHFARVAPEQWGDHMMPVSDFLARPGAVNGDHVPYVWSVDDADVLQRIVVDGHVVQAARRCLEIWHQLQELGGAHNSHAQRLIERERSAWEADKAKEIAAPSGTATPVQPAAVASGASSAIAPAEPTPPETVPAAERSQDEAYIETIRCSSCNECTQINERMFAYNGDKQAYIKDLAAGTYRQLVEAAESCQLSIIHPGKPRDPAEAGLAELVERARPFL